MFHSIKLWLIRNLIQPLILKVSGLIAIGLYRYVPDNAAHKVFSKHGFHLLRKHFYLPIPDSADLNEQFWQTRSQLVGIEMNDPAALDLLQNIFPLYAEEFRGLFPIHQSSDPTQFYLINGSFMAVDAHVYYTFIRHFKPKRVVEIGSGASTLLAATASRQNYKEKGEEVHLTSIEPYPSPVLKKGFQGLSQLVERKVQDVNLELLTSLESGDILFIDSTHVLRAGGDVQFEYCEILPRLAPGVLVHIHDISLPKPYPRVYFEDNHYYWNEQYLLQAFLAFNSKYEVLWPGNYMMTKYPDSVCALFPEYHIMRESFPLSEPSSFWMRVTA